MSLPAKPTVLHVISHLGLGGAERVCFELMRGLSDDHAFAVYAALGVRPGAVGAQMREELAARSIPLSTGAPVRFSRGGLAIGAVRFPAELRPAVIHVHTEVPEAACAAARWIKPGLRGTPVVRTIHNSVYWPAHRRFGRWCARQLADSHVAAVSPAALGAFDELQREAGAAAPASRRVIANGVSVVRARPLAMPDRGRVRVLFAGRLEPQKGADLLPRIVSATHIPNGTRVELQIYGEGSVEAPLRSLATAPPPGWTVRVDGAVPDLPARLAAFDLLVMPSRFEGLSILALEALASGVPIVATDALREGLPDGHGWIARAGDASAFAALLGRVLAAPESWTTVAERGRRFAQERFSAAAMCEAYRALYAQAVQAARTPVAAASNV